MGKLAELQFRPDPIVRCRDYAIGCIGAGFIMADVHLEAYERFGFNVGAIASRTPENAREVAKRRKIAKCYRTPIELLDDQSIEIIDIAYPPHLQLGLVREAVKRPHLRGILLQKPVAMNLEEAEEIARLCADNGKIASVNQNMRFDQSMRVLKQILDENILGDPIVATIEMRAIPHWAAFLDGYNKLTLLNMSIHHLDVMRFLFGEVKTITTIARRDPRTKFAHEDGICVSTLNFESGVLGVCIDDVWATPEDMGVKPEQYIKWRVEGSDGVAEGTIGWPDYPEGSPSTLRYCSKASMGKWVTPTWDSMWFPDAFGGVMEQLQFAISRGQVPEIDLQDNLRTMALVDAAYLSMSEHRTISVAETAKFSNRAGLD